MVSFLIKSTIVMAVLLFLYHLLLEREKMHRFNRLYLLAALVFTFALPFVSIPVYVETIAEPVSKTVEMINTALPVQHFTAAPKPSAVPATIIQPEINYWPYIITGIYALITLMLAIRFLRNISHFMRKSALNEKIPYRGAILVLLKEKIVPHTFLTWIFINEDDYKANAIENDLYTHELTHVKQWHTLDILFIEVLKTIFWFNPLLYFYKKAIQLNHEFLADEGVTKTSDTPQYQRLLLQKTAFGSTIALASNLNFSLTKKRFNMMTKTTPKTKSCLLKITALLTTSLLVYALGTHTVSYSKTPDGKTILLPEVKTKTIIEDIDILPEEIIPEEIIPEQVEPKPANSDTISGDARRDEYYSGVKITIDDKLRNVYYSGKYENLSLDHKRYYLHSVPEKKKAKGISKEDFDYSLTFTDGNFYIDEQKITRKEILKHKREDFAYFAMKMSGTTGPGPERKKEEMYQFFYYTYPYFKKNVSSVNDHYPGEVCEIMITDKPKEYLELHANQHKKAVINDLEKMKADVKESNYSHIDDMKASNRNKTAQFPGGEDQFDEYLDKNLDQDILKGKTVKISFTIETDGSITEISVRDENDPKIIAEVKRVMEKCPKWIPNQREGIPSQTSTLRTYTPAQ